MELYQDSFELTRLLLQRGMAGIYLLAFLSALHQFRPLLGEEGLLPVPQFLKHSHFRESPSLFHFHYSDQWLVWVCRLGILVSGSALLGLTEMGPLWLSVGAWLLLWVLYLSLVNVGQTFYGFGWETMVLEMGFFISFLGPAQYQASAIPILILRWMLFRVEVGAGLIKMRHDSCWRDLTCLYYHYETQPLPNPLSWYFHQLPKWFHKLSVLGSHLVQILVPFGLFAPQPVAGVCALLIIFHQVWLIICGNYSWLNWVTVVLGLSGLGDSFFGWSPSGATLPFAYQLILCTLALATLSLSIEPAKNLFSKNQRMNCSYHPLRLVNSYGAFGSVTRERYEVILEGTDDEYLSPQAEWREYAFKAKPGDPHQRPPQIAPYHLRLDWQMWFLPFTARVVKGRLRVFRKPVWFMKFVERLLQAHSATLSLLAVNPFPDKAPVYIRARYYLYRFTDLEERKRTGRWWTRELMGNYLDPVYLNEHGVI